MSVETWTPEAYDLTREPGLRSTVVIPGDAELAANFPRAAKWSPDGSAILSQCENRTFQLFKSDEAGDIPTSEKLRHVFPQAAPILDFVWFPTATLHDPASFCFVASVRECPVKLLDASDGRLRASYSIVDHRERHIAPHSLAFNLTAERLYCGFEDAIEIFDVSRPGEGRRVPTTPSKKSKDGLKGIISSLAFSPTYGSDESYFAAGTFNATRSNIALFSDADDQPLMFVGGGPRAGVTQLQFNPMNPNILYASYRGSGTGSIYSWDIRSDVNSPLEIFQISDPSPLVQDSRTNQKMRFDVDLMGRMLSVGDQGGNISIFDLGTTSVEEENTVLAEESDLSIPIRRPALQFKAHADAVGSVAFHPYKPCLLSVAGSRHFTTGNDDEVDSDDSDEDEEPLKAHRRPAHSQPATLDSTIKLWDTSITRGS